MPQRRNFPAVFPSDIDWPGRSTAQAVGRCLASPVAWRFRSQPSVVGARADAGGKHLMSGRGGRRGPGPTTPESTADAPGLMTRNALKAHQPSRFLPCLHLGQQEASHGALGARPTCGPWPTAGRHLSAHPLVLTRWIADTSVYRVNESEEPLVRRLRGRAQARRLLFTIIHQADLRNA